jgi:ABC-2 type transport system permease protein
MQRRTIWAIVRKDAIDLWLNKSTLGGLLFPILLSLVWVFVSKVMGNRTIDFLVFDPQDSRVTQAAMAAFPSANLIKAGSADEVAAAFAPDRPANAPRYAVGLVIPAGFEDDLRAGTHPQLQLYMDGSKVDAQAEALIQTAITSYAHDVANPQPPMDLTTTVINPPSGLSVETQMRGVYIPLAALLSLSIGTAFVPQLLIEEKERKTLRMLMVSPASFSDILIAKLLVVLVYQLVLTGVVLAVMGAFTGHFGLVVLYALLGSCFSLALGLLFGSAFSTVSSATAAQGLVIFVYVLAGLFVGPLGALMGGNLIAQIAKVLPTYYVAEGVYNASQALGSAASNTLDICAILGSTIALLLVSVWLLRRQAAVLGTI